MYMDAFGLRPVLREMAAELAAHGYYVLVPNVLYRHGPAPVIELPEFISAEHRPELIEKLIPLVVAYTVDQIKSDADAFLDFLGSRSEVSGGPVGVTGYCIGGMLAMRTAATHADRVAAVAGFHGGPLVTDDPDSPHRSFSRIKAEVLLGNADGDMTPEVFAELNEALNAAGVEYTSEIYPGAAHGFTMADTEAFSPDGLRRHWDDLLPLLDRALKGHGTA